MKKINLTLAASAMFTQILSAQVALESKTASDVPLKKIVIGAGVSNAVLMGIGEGIGANFKFDYLLTNKVSVGLRSMITTNTYGHWTTPAEMLGSGLFGHGVSIDYKPGNIFNFMLTSTYYIFGENSNKGKGGIYASLELGYSNWKMSYTQTSLASVSDLLYYTYSQDWEVKCFAGLISIGGDRKLGPGRIYLELPLIIPIYGTDAVNYYDTSGYNRSDHKESGYQYFNHYLFLNLGYQLYL